MSPSETHWKVEGSVTSVVGNHSFGVCMTLSSMSSPEDSTPVCPLALAFFLSIVFAQCSLGFRKCNTDILSIEQSSQNYNYLEVSQLIPTEQRSLSVCGYK